MTTYNYRAEPQPFAKNGNYVSFTQHWSSWGDLLADAETGAKALVSEGNDHFMPVREGLGSDTFHFESHSTAQKAAYFGWAEGTQKLLSSVDAIADQIGDIAETISNHMLYDVAGELPDVGAYCAGVAEHMISWPMDHASKPVVRLAVCVSKPFSVTAEQSANWGVAIVALVDALELAGRDVELTLYTAARCNAGRSRTAQRLQYVTVKPAGEHIDRDRLAYVLVSADMLRRTMLSALGHEDKHTYESGYGVPIHLSDFDNLSTIAPTLVDALLVTDFSNTNRDSRNAYNTPQGALDTILFWAKDNGVLA